MIPFYTRKLACDSSHVFYDMLYFIQCRRYNKMALRPLFSTIKTFEEFKIYYWYLVDLQAICKSNGIDHRGNKIELNQRIELYFQGTIESSKTRTSYKKVDAPLTLETKLLESGFAMRTQYRASFLKNIWVFITFILLPIWPQL